MLDVSMKNDDSYNLIFLKAVVLDGLEKWSYTSAVRLILHFLIIESFQSEMWEDLQMVQ
jgi:hypothetical protein